MNRKYLDGARLYWNGRYVIAEGAQRVDLRVDPRMVIIDRLMGFNPEMSTFEYRVDGDSGGYIVQERDLSPQAPGEEPDTPDFERDNQNIIDGIHNHLGAMLVSPADMVDTRISSIPLIKEPLFSVFEVSRCLAIPRPRIREWISEGIIFSDSIRYQLHGQRHGFTRWDIYGIWIVNQMRTFKVPVGLVRNIFQLWKDNESGMRKTPTSILFMVADGMGIHIATGHIIKTVDRLIHQAGRK